MLSNPPCGLRNLLPTNHASGLNHKDETIQSCVLTRHQRQFRLRLPFVTIQTQKLTLPQLSQNRNPRMPPEISHRTILATHIHMIKLKLILRSASNTLSTKNPYCLLSPNSISPSHVNRKFILAHLHFRGSGRTRTSAGQ